MGILSKSWYQDSQKHVKSNLNLKIDRFSLDLAKANFLVPAFLKDYLVFCLLFPATFFQASQDDFSF